MTDSPLHLDFSSHLDAFELFLLRADSNPRTRSATLSILTFDQTPDFDALKRAFDRTSRNFVRLRQKVVQPSVPVVPARWVVDPDFDLDYHVRRVTLPGAARMQDLLHFSGQFFADPMDNSRPLWEALLVEGVKERGNKAALLFKSNHALTDGYAGMIMLQQLLSTDPEAPEPPMPLLPIPEELNGDDLLKEGLMHRAGDWIPNIGRYLRKAIDTGSKLYNDPKTYRDELLKKLDSARRVAADLPAPPSPLMTERGLGRQLCVLEVPMKNLRQAAKKHNGSLNDAYLAAVAGALRLYHQHMGIDVDNLSMSMPVNLRKKGEETGGNNFTSARLALPIAETDAAARISLIHSRVMSALREPALDIVHTIAPLITTLPDSVFQQITTSFTMPEIQISNVMGPPRVLYLNGAKVTKMFPFGPVPGVAVMVTMVSMAGTCYFGTHLDTAAIKDPELFNQCLKEGIDEVCALAGPAPSTQRQRKAPARRKAKAAKPTSEEAAE